MITVLSSRLRKAIAWLALGALCFGAAAPTVSKWLVWNGQASDLLVICNQHGTMLIPAAQLQDSNAAGHDQHGGQPGHPGQPGQGDDFCPYCTLVHHWPYAPVVAQAFAPQVLPAAPAVAAEVAVAQLQVWHRPYLARAPPLALA